MRATTLTQGSSQLLVYIKFSLCAMSMAFIIVMAIPAIQIQMSLSSKPVFELKCQKVPA